MLLLALLIHFVMYTGLPHKISLKPISLVKSFGNYLCTL